MITKRIRPPHFISTQVSDARYALRDFSRKTTQPLQLVCGGSERCNPDYRIQRGSFPYYSVECVAEGEGQLRLKNVTHRLLPGTVFSYGPGIAHTISNHPDRPMRKYFIDFLGTQARSLFAKTALDGGRIIQVASPQQVVELFEMLLREGNTDTPFTDRICANLIELLLLKIGELAVPPGSIQTRAWVAYQRIHCFLDEHYATLRSLEEAAAQCHMDRAYICRLFQRFDHTSPYQYLLRLKMNRAAELLKTSGGPIKAVAAELKFSDPYHFSRIFKKMSGVSPRQFLQTRETPPRQARDAGTP